LCWTVSQRSARRAGAGEVLELEKVVSCRSGDLWRRAKLQVGSREPLDDLHRCTALGAAIQGAGAVCGWWGGVLRPATESKAVESWRADDGPRSRNFGTRWWWQVGRSFGERQVKSLKVGHHPETTDERELARFQSLSPKCVPESSKTGSTDEGER
jgi:hypothetical protein